MNGITQATEEHRSGIRVSCLQMNCGEDTEENIEQALSLIEAAVRGGSEFVMTPENTGFLSGDSEAAARVAVGEDSSPVLLRLVAAAKRHSIHLLIGSLLVREGAGVHNRSYLVNTRGEVTARYDKLHLFEAHLANGEEYRESDTISAGRVGVIAATPWAHLGMSVCYDLRFPRLYRGYARAGAEWLTVPSAFTVPTGRAHWHILLRARAIENGCFVFAPAQAGLHPKGRRTFGHTMIVNPWGEVLAEAAGDTPQCVTARIVCDEVRHARERIPALEHEREVEIC
ncbi:MAG: carbon-nitrogen hydrolase family protein [Alphaproteobacteria bacterium]